MTDSRDFAHAETLRNGLAVTIRLLRPDDRHRIVKAPGINDPAPISHNLFPRLRARFGRACPTRRRKATDGGVAVAKQRKEN
jgi:hypothetical protein